MTKICLCLGFTGVQYTLTVMDLLVLVGGNRSKDGLWEAECLHTLPSGNRFGWGKLAAEVLPDHMDTRLIFVHGVQDDLEINTVIFITYSGAFTKAHLRVSCCMYYRLLV